MPQKSNPAPHQVVKGGGKNTNQRGGGKHASATTNPAVDIAASAIKANLVHYKPDGPACDTWGGTVDYEQVIKGQLALSK